MGERKVQSKYIPSDFNPTKAGHRSKPQNGQHDVRFMLPMSIQCSTCGDYMFQGTKANSRKEICYNEFYLGLPVFRFYIHCKNCFAEITIKTDPEHSDYIIETGATRHFEPWLKVQLENIEEEKERMQKSSIEVLENEFHSKDHDLKQTDELERLVEANHKRKKVKARDLLRIHEMEGKNEHLTPSDLKMVETFEDPNQKPILKKQKVKKSIQLKTSAFVNPAAQSLLDYGDDYSGSD